MAQSPAEQKARFPAPAYNYRVDVDGIAMSFAEVSGITIEYAHVTYRDGFSFLDGETLARARIPKFSAVTMKRGIVPGIADLSDWLAEGDERTVDVSLCDEAGSPVVTWHVRSAIPVKLEAPTFDAKTNEVSVESLEVMAANVSIEHHGAG